MPHTVRTTIIAALLAFGWPTLARAQVNANAAEGVRLAYTWRAGETVVYCVRVRSVVRFQQEGDAGRESEQSLSFEAKVSIAAAEPDGAGELIIDFTGCDGGGDATDAEPGAEGRSGWLVPWLYSRDVAATVTERGEVRSVGVLGEGEPRPTEGQIGLVEKLLLDELLIDLPAAPVRPGDTWRAAMGSVGELGEAERRWRLEGVSDDGRTARLVLEHDAAADGEVALSAEAVFDRERGRVVRVEVAKKVDLEMDGGGGAGEGVGTAARQVITYDLSGGECCRERGEAGGG